MEQNIKRQLSECNIQSTSSIQDIELKAYNSQAFLNQKPRNQISFDDSLSISSQKIQSSFNILLNQPSQTSLNNQSKKSQMTKQQVQSLNKIFTQIRQFRVDRINKVKLYSPSKIIISQTIIIWNKRFMKDPNFIFYLYIIDLPKQVEEQFLKQQFLYCASIKLYIQGCQFINKKAVHFLKDQSYYEGVEDDFMMITKRTPEVIRYFEGKVKNNLPFGKGSVIQQLKGKILWSYFGDFVQGKRQGEGKQTLAKGIIYEGEFKNDVKHGKGIQITIKKRKHPQPNQDLFIEKNRYEGCFQNGYRHGQGVETTSHGQYTGLWYESVKKGKGIIKYKNGHSYQGQWANNCFNGEGVYIETVKIGGQFKQNIYTGQFSQGYYHGKGVMEYANGDKYEGLWAFGKKQGQGMYNWVDGDYYDGNWEKDSAEGTGAACFGGKFYDGEFHLGLKHGLGQQTDDDGNTTKAMWFNNQIIKKLEINGQIVEE